MTDPTMNDFNQQIIDEFRANDGVVGGPFEGARMLLLHTTGAKSGKPRVIPLVYRTDDDRLVVFGSKGGAPTNPDWYHNLRAHPEVTVELGPDRFRARATVSDDVERRRLFDQHAAKMPAFADYEKKTTRKIPVVVLERL